MDTNTAEARVRDVNKNLQSSASAILVFENRDGGVFPKILGNLCHIHTSTNEHNILLSVSMGWSLEEIVEDIGLDSNLGGTLPVWSATPPILILFSNMPWSDGKPLASLTLLIKPKGQSYVYLKGSINECWEKVLLNQGLHVYLGFDMANDDVDKLYAQVREVWTRLLEDAFSFLL
ncbi:hypothetical protein BD769DRAFT_1395853 [Suillus cothurnatus]|nr:hypothetical protein BD769DRAFT_1395853 [Suillus cothurnatus]